MTVTCGDCRLVYVRSVLRRRAPIRRGAVTELEDSVQAPGPQRPIRLDGERMTLICCYQRPVLVRPHLNGGEPLRIRRSVPELTEHVVAPRPERSVRLHR